MSREIAPTYTPKKNLIKCNSYLGILDRYGNGFDSTWQVCLILFLIILCNFQAHAQIAQPSPVPTATSRPSESVIGAPVTADPVRMTNPALRINPLFEVSERFTDNVALTNEVTAQRDWVTETTAGLEADYRGPNASARLDYRISSLLYRNLTRLNGSQRQLNSSANLEPIEKWLFLDARAGISQQSRSAFGSASIADISSTSGNRVETTTYQLSPYVRGDFADFASYLLRVNATNTRTRDVQFSDSSSREWTGYFKNTPSGGRMGWSIDGNVVQINSSAIGTRRNSRAASTMTYEVDVQLHVSASIGTESSNMDGSDKRTTNMRGIGMEWAPSQRTQIAAVFQKRFFGNEHLLAIGHRTHLTAWRFSSGKEIAFSSDELSSSRFSVNNLLLDLLASTNPDPIARAQAAQQRLQQTGIPTSSGIQNGFLTVRPILQSRQEVSAALVGVRNTVTITGGRRDQRAIDTVDASSANFAPIEQVRQVSANAAWAYRVSPASSVRMVFSRLHTQGLFSSSLMSTQRLQSLFFATRLGPNTAASIGAQRIVFESSVSPSYRENAFVSSLSFHF